MNWRRLFPAPPHRLLIAGLLPLLAAAGCTASIQTAGDAPPTVAEARDFLDRAETELASLWIDSERAAWVQANFITQDTELMAAQAYEAVLARTAALAKGAARFDGLDLDAATRRKLRLLKTSLPLAAPADAPSQQELALLATGMESLYGKGRYCPHGEDNTCLDLGRLSRVMAESRDPDELLAAWEGWRTIAPPLAAMYGRFAELANEGARDLGFPDLGALWRSGYDMPPEAFAAEMDRLWEQVRPLYEALHCHVRARLSETHGAAIVPPEGPIPAHLLGNMWAQSWANLHSLVAPPSTEPGYDLTAILRDREMPPTEMVRIGERFFTSLGFEPMPASFWQRSLFTRPRDRDVVCHPSAWNLDMDQDLRIKMCIEPTAEDFSTIHHELGHNIYQRAYRHQDPLYRGGAHDGFHEGIGDTIALSITPGYLVDAGLLNQQPGSGGDLDYLMRMALDKVAFLPFGLLVDRWRWQVFSGEVPPERYNEAWWDLRRQYQGVRPPRARPGDAFDPGAKYHVPANTPYARYFLAHILQFQFHRALCDAAGYQGPLHACSVYGEAEAGRRLAAMLEMGQSRPWPDALEALTGTRNMDGGAILDYFGPLQDWLAEQNAERSCGW